MQAEFAILSARWMPIPLAGKSELENRLANVSKQHDLALMQRRGRAPIHRGPGPAHHTRLPNFYFDRFRAASPFATCGGAREWLRQEDVIVEPAPVVS